jgi:hypothetical protein
MKKLRRASQKGNDRQKTVNCCIFHLLVHPLPERLRPSPQLPSRLPKQDHSGVTPNRRATANQSTRLGRTTITTIHHAEKPVDLL